MLVKQHGWIDDIFRHVARTRWCQTKSQSVQRVSSIVGRMHIQDHEKPYPVNITTNIFCIIEIYLRWHLKPKTSEWFPTAFLDTLTDTISGLPTERQFEMNLQETLRRSKSEQLRKHMVLKGEEFLQPLKNSSLLCPFLRSIGGNCEVIERKIKRKSWRYKLSHSSFCYWHIVESCASFFTNSNISIMWMSYLTENF